MFFTMNHYNFYRMEGGELFNRIQEKKSFTEKGNK